MTCKESRADSNFKNLGLIRVHTMSNAAKAIHTMEEQSRLGPPSSIVLTPYMRGKGSRSSLRVASVLRKKHHCRAAFRSGAVILVLLGYLGHNILSSPSDVGIVTRLFTSRGTDDLFLKANWEVVQQNEAWQTERYVSGEQVKMRRELLDLNGKIEEPSNLAYFAVRRQSSFVVEGNHRLLALVQGPQNSKQSVPCSSIPTADPEWMLLFYIIGVLYMFLAIAIVCDEFFVPALEEMSDEHHLNLSMDVSGATLMAAGGSAPELFTNLFGTFRESQVGFGTIVGSAVFNVLFVIGICAFLAGKVLHLTWWPLCRDCSYYILSLVMLAVFIGVVSPGKIYVWEAIVLFILYFGYVALMYFNEQIYERLTGKKLYPEETTEGGSGAVVADGSGSSPQTQSSEHDTTVENGHVPRSARAINNAEPSSDSVRPSSAPWPGTFRAGILKLLRDPDSWSRTAGVGIVSQIEGDVHSVFSKVDKNGDGVIDKEELKLLFQELDCHVTDAQVDSVMDEVDENKDGEIQQEEFVRWYVVSEERIRSKIRTLFDLIDANNSGTIDREEVKMLLQRLDPRATDQDVDDAFAAMYQSGSRDEITYEEFSTWYTSSLLYDQRVKDIEEELGGVWEFILPPKTCSCWAYIKWILVLPILLVLTVTIPDVRVIHWGKFGRCKRMFCYFSFIISIIWIGSFSYLMVDWAEIIGNTFGIPSVVMGYTFIAAGTSVPDCLSSVIVARRGEGDMAISNSVGSNIFDILVGLPVPWALFTIIETQFVLIDSEGVWISIFVLLATVVLIIGSIHFNGWKLTKGLGAFMFVLYGAFLVQAIWLQLPFPKCNPNA